MHGVYFNFIMLFCSHDHDLPKVSYWDSSMSVMGHQQIPLNATPPTRAVQI